MSGILSWITWKNNAEQQDKEITIEIINHVCTRFIIEEWEIPQCHSTRSDRSYIQLKQEANWEG